MKNGLYVNEVTGELVILDGFGYCFECPFENRIRYGFRSNAIPFLSSQAWVWIGNE